jgi:hypothetical protein
MLVLRAALLVSFLAFGVYSGSLAAPSPVFVTFMCTRPTLLRFHIVLGTDRGTNDRETQDATPFLDPDKPL